MTSEQALALAIEQVNKLSTNARGYADGVTLTQKIDAVERIAAFLMGDGATATDAAGEGDAELVVDFGEHWHLDVAEHFWRCNLCGAITEDHDPHREWHQGLGR
jgi:hypothetical protein